MAHDLDAVRQDADHPDHDPIGAQLDQLKTRLVQEYAGRSDVNEGTVRSLVDQAREQFDGAKIRAFVPILVERQAHERLGRPQHATA